MHLASYGLSLNQFSEVSANPRENAFCWLLILNLILSRPWNVSSEGVPLVFLPVGVLLYMALSMNCPLISRLILDSYLIHTQNKFKLTKKQSLLIG